MIETWKTIPGYTRYEASTLGRIRSLYAGTHTIRRKRKRPLILKFNQLKNNSYLQVSIGKRPRKLVASLVAMTFIGLKPKGLQINHIDGVKTNNAVKNLEYCTASENIRHAVNNGLFKASCRKKT